MEDREIVALYWARSERAIAETADKYGAYLDRIAYGILANAEDAQECVNDTYHDAWNAMPPHRPSVLSTFLGKITRRIAIDRWRRANAQKRGSGELHLILEELEECAAAADNVQDAMERQEWERIFNAFLASLPAAERRVFLRRYWYADPIATIAKRFGYSQSKVTSMLYRTRAKLRARLEQEAADESR